MTDEMQDGMVARTEGFIEQKKGAEAEQEASELVDLGPEEPIAWFMKGKALYTEDRFDEALACFSKAAELKNDQEEIWHMMGYCLVALARYDEALQALEYVKGVNDKNATALFALGAVYTIKGDAQNAKQNIDLAFSLDRPIVMGMATDFYNKFFANSEQVTQEQKQSIVDAINAKKQQQ